MSLIFNYIKIIIVLHASVNIKINIKNYASYIVVYLHKALKHAEDFADGSKYLAIFRVLFFFFLSPVTCELNKYNCLRVR